MSKVSENKIKSAEVVQFINKLNSSDTKKLIRFKGLFDKNSDGKINDSNSGKETELFENFLYNASEYNAKFKTIIKNLNNLSKEEYDNLKEYLTKNNGKLPEWFLSDVKQIKKEEKKYSKNLDISGEEEIYKRAQVFRKFDDDIGFYRLREHNINEKIMDLLVQGGTKKTERTPDGEKKEIITNKNNDTLLSVSYDENNNITGYSENINGKIYTTSFYGTISDQKIIDEKTSKLESEITYDKDIKKIEIFYDDNGQITKHMTYANVNSEEKITGITEFTYNKDNSYTEIYTPGELNKTEMNILLEKGGITKTIKEYDSENNIKKYTTYSGERIKEETFYNSDGEITVEKKYDLISGKLKETKNLISENEPPKMVEPELEIIDIPETQDSIEEEIDDIKDEETEDKKIEDRTDDNPIKTDADKKIVEKPVKPRPQGAKSLFKNMTLTELQNKTEYLRNLNRNNTEDINDVIQILQSPDSAKILAGEQYNNTPYANNGIKIMVNILNKIKNPKMSSAERARNVDFIYKMITDKNYYIRNSYIDRPNGKLDKPRYQNDEGNCWLLETANGLNRTPKGRELLDEILEPDSKTDGAIVHLDGGKKHYRVTLKQLSEAFSLSSGEYDMRAIEIAVNRYRNDEVSKTQWSNKNDRPSTGETDFNKTYGGHAHEALEAFTGNKTIKASVENGVLGVKIDNEFVPINKENAQRLKRIPLIIPASTENLEMLKQYGDDVVIFSGLSEHQYSMEFNNYGDLDTHEPWSSENSMPFQAKEIAPRSTLNQIDIMFL